MLSGGGGEIAIYALERLGLVLGMSGEGDRLRDNGHGSRMEVGYGLKLGPP